MEKQDLCISFDDTGSMHSVRMQVRSKINELVSQLFASIPGLRVSLIIHNDYCDAPRHIFVQDFTTDLDKIKKFVNQDSPCGGGDAPECYELALHEATKLSWESDKRAFILIGDEVPHAVGYRYGSFTNTLEWRNETSKLNEMNVQIYGVQALGNSRSTHFYDTISKITGGTKLDLSQFQHINTYINAVAHQQSGQLDTYQASDPSFSTNIALRNMFKKLQGKAEDSGFSEKVMLMSRFQMMDVPVACPIKEFVETNGCTFKKGKGYYSLIERTADGKANVEEIQPAKEVIFIDKETGEVSSDSVANREMLKVPFGTRGKVHPIQIPDVMKKYDIFIQSTSVNRRLDAGTKFLYALDHI